MKVKLKTGFAGSIGGVDSPIPGTEIEVSDEVGNAMIADGRAAEVGSSSSKKTPPTETTSTEPPENTATRTTRSPGRRPRS